MITNDVIKNIANRRSIRKYKDTPVEDARPRRDLEEIVMFEKWDR